MSAIQINTKIENGYTIYTFEANNTKYDVITRDGKEFTVYSKRKNCGFDTAVKVYYSLTELAARSKAFFNFSKLIEA